MFNNAQDLYHSKEWEKLIRVIKQERVDDNGQIICEHCGQPIVKAYDIIAHHKVELNDENVNDIEIGLNPENIALVHHRCHNEIHNRFGRNTRGVYLVYGAPLSGKSSWVRDNMSAGDLLIDIDNIWECVSGCKRYEKPKRLNAVVFKIRDDLLNACKYRLGHWVCCYIVGGYPLQAERERLCREMGAQEIYIESSREECLSRMADRPKEWAAYIEDWFTKAEAGATS